MEYDDLFVYAPSFLLYECVVARGEVDLWEGKYVGTARENDLALAGRDRAMDQFLFPEEFARERKKGSTVGRRRFKDVKARAFRELLTAVELHDRGATFDTDFREEAHRIMREAWRESFLAGLRASGIEGLGRGRKGIALTPHDERWLRSAMQHEMRFLNRFVDAITRQDYTMPLRRRTEMYADALESFYDSARVIGMPTNTLVRWTGPRDKSSCESCKYIRAQNPFHKNRLPATPRSGLTRCLTNCRDRLVLRAVDLQTAIREQVRRPTREQMIRHLRRLKSRRGR